MRAMRISILLALTSVLLVSLAASAAPGAGRLPHEDYQELLRYQILGPDVDPPQREYTFFSAVPIGEEQRDELEGAGLSLVSAFGNRGVVRGPLPAFDGLGPGQVDLPWILELLPEVPPVASQESVPAPIDIEAAIQALKIPEVHKKDITGTNVTVGIIDGQFTGALGQSLGEERVQYFKVEYTRGLPTGIVPMGDDDFAAVWSSHGEQCAEGVLAVAPDANLVMMLVTSVQDYMFFLSEIAAGKVEIDVLSDSLAIFPPEDHSDGLGPIAQAGNAVFDSGVFYSKSLGNMGSGGPGSHSYYGGIWEDVEGNSVHNFTPDEDEYLERNTLAFQVHDYPSFYSVTLWVLLSWDGWEYQVRNPDTSDPWTQEEYITVQDLDMNIWYDDGTLPRIVYRANRDQLQYAYPDSWGHGRLSVRPLEAADIRNPRPGRYLIEVRNVTEDHKALQATERDDIELRLYVFTQGPAELTMEQHTPEGSIINMAGAHEVTAVGALEWESNAWRLADYSSQGPTSDGRLKPELVAPTNYASEISVWGVSDGTSASAPLVAGVAALLRGANPTLSPSEVRDILTGTASPQCGKLRSGGPCNTSVVDPELCVEWSYSVGCGIPNALAAVERALAMAEEQLEPEEKEEETEPSDEEQPASGEKETGPDSEEENQTDEG